jgi:hypothetical protein
MQMPHVKKSYAYVRTLHEKICCQLKGICAPSLNIYKALGNMHQAAYGLRFCRKVLSADIKLSASREAFEFFTKGPFFTMEK